MSITAAAAAALTATNFVNGTVLPQNNIGGIPIRVLIEEEHTSTLETTEHPVEAGAEITDHSYMRPLEVTLRCGWSDASVFGLADAVFELASGVNPITNDYVSYVHSQLLALQQSRQLFSIQTTLLVYNNMLVTQLSILRDQKTAKALMVTAVARQIILSHTQPTTLPPQVNMANPAASAETVQGGTVATSTGTPAPGGAAPPETWTQTAP